MNADKARIAINIGGTGQLKVMPELNALLREGIHLVQDTAAKMGGTVQGLPSAVWIEDSVIQFSLPMGFQAGRLHKFFGQPQQENKKPDEKRTCRICGCTDDNCLQCIEKTGFPCFWIEDDLCSACVNEAYPKKYERDMKTIIHRIDIAFGSDSFTGKRKKDAHKAWLIMEQFADALSDMAFIGTDKVKLLKKALLRIVEYGSAQSAIQKLGKDD